MFCSPVRLQFLFRSSVGAYRVWSEKRSCFMWDKSNCSVICTLFKTTFLEKWDERGQRPFLWPLTSFPDRHTYCAHSQNHAVIIRGFRNCKTVQHPRIVNPGLPALSFLFCHDVVTFIMAYWEYIVATDDRLLTVITCLPAAAATVVRKRRRRRRLAVVACAQNKEWHMIHLTLARISSHNNIVLLTLLQCVKRTVYTVE